MDVLYYLISWSDGRKRNTIFWFFLTQGYNGFFILKMYVWHNDSRKLNIEMWWHIFTQYYPSDVQRLLSKVCFEMFCNVCAPMPLALEFRYVTRLCAHIIDEAYNKACLLSVMSILYHQAHLYKPSVISY